MVSRWHSALIPPPPATRTGDSCRMMFRTIATLAIVIVVSGPATAWRTLTDRYCDGGYTPRPGTADLADCKAVCTGLSTCTAILYQADGETAPGFADYADYADDGDEDDAYDYSGESCYTVEGHCNSTITERGWAIYYRPDSTQAPTGVDGTWSPTGAPTTSAPSTTPFEVVSSST